MKTLASSRAEDGQANGLSADVSQAGRCYYDPKRRYTGGFSCYKAKVRVRRLPIDADADVADAAISQVNLVTGQPADQRPTVYQGNKSQA